MGSFQLPYVHLPLELVELLKTNLSSTNLTEQISSKIHANTALTFLIEATFPEFYDSKKLDKMIVALGWTGFRNRLSSLYMSKAQTGKFPNRADVTVVAEVCEFEERFIQYGVGGFGRAYLLGFYLALANRSGNATSLHIPEEIELFLRLSQKRSERIDLLILILCHLYHGLGEEFLINALANGKKIDELYNLLDINFRRQMSDNLLAYTASINEMDMFLYEKV
jgi:hypothetical protein